MLHHRYGHEKHHKTHSVCKECSEAMFNFGAMLAVEIAPPQPLTDLLASQGKTIPPIKTGYALIDTGASVTTLHEQYVKDLGVQAVNARNLSTPSGGVETHNSYPVRLRVPSHNVDEELSEIITADLAKFLTPEGEPIIGLIGRDFLKSFVLIYNGELGMYTLAS